MGVPGYYTCAVPRTGSDRGTHRHHPHRRRPVPATRDNGRPALFHVRSGGSLAGNSAASIQIGEDNTTITGSATTGGFCGKNNIYTVYFVMQFSRPFTSYGTWDGYSVSAGVRGAHSSYIGSSGGYVEFPAGSVVEVQHRAVLRERRRSAGEPRRPRAGPASTTSAPPRRPIGTARSRVSRWPAPTPTT